MSECWFYFVVVFVAIPWITLYFIQKNFNRLLAERDGKRFLKSGDPLPSLSQLPSSFLAGVEEAYFVAEGEKEKSQRESKAAVAIHPKKLVQTPVIVTNFSDVPPETLPKMTILFGTSSGTAKTFAQMLEKEAKDQMKWPSTSVFDMETYDADDLPSEELVVLIASTFIGGKSVFSFLSFPPSFVSHLKSITRPPASAERFYQQVRDEANEPRGGNLLRRVRFAVFGLCNSLYDEKVFNVVGRNLNKWFLRMGGIRIVPLGVGDESHDQDKAFAEFRTLFWQNLRKEEDLLRSSSFVDEETQLLEDPDVDERDADDNDAEDQKSEPLV